MKILKINITSLFLVALLSSSPISINNTSRVVESTIQKFSDTILEIKNMESVSEEGIDLFYIYHLEPKGFVMVSADDRAFPLLGYSFENNFKLEGAPSNINWLINNYKDQILNLINANAIQNNQVRIEWEEYLQEKSSRDETRNVSPLIDAEFDQSGAWNNALTVFGFYGPVGCVAVSMSQIMHYWGYPEQGEGSNSYNEDDYGTLFIDFSTTFYDFDNMAALYATSASQQLLYHTGVSVNMDYDNSGSGASVEGVYPSAEYAFENFFKYNEYINVRYKENFTDTEFRNILKNELEYNRPILYSGYEDSNYNGGHAWNIDGYQNNNLHCNWGWGGWNNGYFNLTSMGGFSSYQTALIDIIPEPLMDPLALFEFEINDMTVTFIDLSEIINESEIEFWNWNYGNGVTETTLTGFNEYTYPESGEYTVMLTVTNIYGQESAPHLETVVIESSMIGDINEDTFLNVLDIVILVNFIVGSESPSNSEFNAADMNDDNLLNVLDIVLLVSLILG